MRILIAPDKFKGSLTAIEAAQAIARGVKSVLHAADVREIPIADGGEGTTDALCEVMGGKWITAATQNALSDAISARYIWIANRHLAIIEMSAAAGLSQILQERRNPLRATTFGVGLLMLDAMRRGANHLLIGIGGSATNDGGIGMAAALGFRFLTSDGDPLEPIPENLLALEAIHPPEKLLLPKMTAMCDVQNPLLGAHGASRIYGPQKGADAQQVLFLDQTLENLADVVKKDFDFDFRDTPGAGAAGGLGFGLLSFCDAEIRSGFEMFAEMTALESEVANSDLVITGEGRLDAQTLCGKAPAGIAALAKRHGKPVIAIGGHVPDPKIFVGIFDSTFSLTDEKMTVSEAIRNAVPLLEKTAACAAALVKVDC